MIESLRKRAAATGGRIALPESGDRRTLEAAVEIKKRGIAEPLLIGERAKIQEMAAQHGRPRISSPRTGTA